MSIHKNAIYCTQKVQTLKVKLYRNFENSQCLLIFKILPVCVQCMGVSPGKKYILSYSFFVSVTVK